MPTLHSSYSIVQVDHPKLVGLDAQNQMKDGTLWVPQLEPMNALSDVSVHNDTYFINGTGCMRWQRLKFTCKARFVLHTFPFDVQLLPVRFESRGSIALKRRPNEMTRRRRRILVSS